MRSPLVFILCVVGLEAPLFAQHSSPPATEAPAGFDTPTLVKNPGSGSTSNGIIEPPGDQFALDQQIYETQHDINNRFAGLSVAEKQQLIDFLESL